MLDLSTMQRQMALSVTRCEREPVPARVVAWLLLACLVALLGLEALG